MHDTSCNYLLATYIFNIYICIRKEDCKVEFPGGPVVKTSPSSAGGVGLIPGWGAKIPPVLQPKNIKQKPNQILYQIQ